MPPGFPRVTNRVSRFAAQTIAQEGGCAIIVRETNLTSRQTSEFADRNRSVLGHPIDVGADHGNRTSVTTRTDGRIGYEVRTCAQTHAIYIQSCDLANSLTGTLNICSRMRSKSLTAIEKKLRENLSKAQECAHHLAIIDQSRCAARNHLASVSATGSVPASSLRALIQGSE